MNQRGPIGDWGTALCRYRIWLVAGFVFTATWTLQAFLDEHLQSAGHGFGPGYLHFVRQLDHFLVFVGGGFLIAERRWVARFGFPLACAGMVVLGWVIWDWDWPWATNSMLPLLFLVATSLGLQHLHRLPTWLIFLPLAWLFLCHLDSNCEFGADAAGRPAFVAGLALAALLSAALGVVLGRTIVVQQTVPFTVLVLLTMALALAMS